MNLSSLSEAQQARVVRARQTVPFATLLGLQIHTVELTRAVLTMEVREELKQNNAIVHGGAIATLIDSAMAFAIIPHLEDNETSTTVDITVHYLRPLTTGVAVATARIVRAGRRVIIVESEVVDDQGRPAATGISTVLRLPKV